MTTSAHPVRLSTIGQRLKYLMDRRRMNQTELAHAADVTQAAISNLMRDSGRRPTGLTLIGLAAALQANPRWILNGEGAPFHQVDGYSNANEKALVDAYRTLSPEAKRAILAAARAMGESERE